MIPKSNPIPSFNAEERGVSPVIGVILMVAITVILAAVIGSFVLGIGGNVNKTPQASFTFDPGADEIIHQGGDEFDINNLKVTGDITDDPPTISNGGSTLNAGGAISTSDFGPQDTVRLVWEDPQSDNTAVIATYNT